MDTQWIIDKYGMDKYYISLPFTNSKARLRVYVYADRKYGDNYGYELVEKYRGKVVKKDEDKKEWVKIPQKPR